MKDSDRINQLYTNHLEKHMNDEESPLFLAPFPKPTNLTTVTGPTIQEPIPAKQYCEACCDNFKCYLTHVSSLQH